MLKKLKQAKDEWGGTLSILDNWLDENEVYLNKQLLLSFAKYY